VIPLAAIASSGCAARLNQFNTFAQAGITYTTASQTLLNEAGHAAVNTDSALLTRHRDEMSEARRRAIINESDKKLKDRLAVLDLIGAHGRLLAAYFQAVAALSDPKAGESVGTSAQGLYDALAKISPRLKEATVGSQTVSSFIPEIADPVVAIFKARALDNELKARACLIAKELALQQAAFQTIAAEFRTDAKELQQFQEVDSINQFVSSGDLAPDWASQRPALLASPSTIASIDAAAKAADQLGKAWAALVSGRLDGNGFNLLMTDISNLLTITQTIQSAIK